MTRLEQLRALNEQRTPGPWSWMATGEKDNSWSLGVAVWPDGSPVTGELGEQEADRWDAAGQPDDSVMAAAIAATIVEHIADSARDLGPLADPAFVAASANAMADLLTVAEAARTLEEHETRDRLDAVWREDLLTLRAALAPLLEEASQ